MALCSILSSSISPSLLVRSKNGGFFQNRRRLLTQLYFFFLLCAPPFVIFRVFPGPRLILCYLWYLLVVRNVPANGSKGFAKFLFTNDVIRTVACGGWVYVTSSDDHDIHDIAMAVYLVCTIPHVVMTIKSAPQNAKAQWYRKLFAYTFFGALVPMIYFFIQHNVHRIPGGKKERKEKSPWINDLRHLDQLCRTLFSHNVYISSS